MNRIDYLGIKEIMQIHEDVIEDTGGAKGIREMSGIESAISSPQAVYFGKDMYPTIAEKAATLCFELVSQHPFMDGNKRVGHAAMVHFLFMNGYFLDENDLEQEVTMLNLASGKIEKPDFAVWVSQRIKPLKPIE